MTNILSLIMSYAEIFMLLSAVCAVILIFIKSDKKNVKTEWFCRAIIIKMLLVIACLNMFIIFSDSIKNSYNYELIQSISSFFSVIMTAMFLTIILAKKQIMKFI